MLFPQILGSLIIHLTPTKAHTSFERGPTLMRTLECQIVGSDAPQLAHAFHLLGILADLVV
jgi:hypothetical protein